MNIDFKLNKKTLKKNLKIVFTLNFTLYIDLHSWKVTKWLVIVSGGSIRI